MATTIFQEHKRTYYRFSWFHLIRPLTLTGTITPMLVGTLFATHHGSIQFNYFLILLVATLLIQMATNIWNDYFDYKQGQDQLKWQQEQHEKGAPVHHQLPYVATLLTCIAAILGLWLAFATTYWLIPIGLAGILFGFYYSAGEKSLSAIGFGELIGTIFLGFVTTILPYIVQGNPVDIKIITIAVPFALLISTMIFTNNIRDIEKDVSFRRTIAYLLGRKRAMTLLTALILLVYLWMFGLVVFEVLPASVLIIVLAIPQCIRLWGTLKNKKMECMKYAALHHWAFGLLFALGLLIGEFF